MNYKKLTSDIINAAIEVHQYLGPGLLENAYRHALATELKLMGHMVEEERPIPVIYKGIEIKNSYYADIIVDDVVIVELKSVEKDNPIFAMQLLTYLKLADKKLGLLINFNKPRVIDGVKRIINNNGEEL